MRLTPAMGVSLAALVLAASGGAYAATSRSSGSIVACVHRKGGGLYVAPKCVRHDKRLTWSAAGQIGPTGATGRDGAGGANATPGTTGETGPPGPPGPFPDVLPQGVTLRGDWAGGSSAPGTAYESISFGFAFSSAPTFNYVPGPSSVPPGCLGGTNVNPTAKPGNLCLYSNGFPDNTKGPVVTGAPDPGGTLFTVQSETAKAFADGGTWAATSP